MSQPLDPLSTREEKLGHQPDAVNTRRVIRVAAVLSVIVVVAMYAMVLLFRGLRAPPADALPDWAVTSPEGRGVGPQLDPNQSVELQRLRRAHRQILSSYAWIDEPQGVARIPIERAIEMLVDEPLPAREEGDE